MRAKRRYNHRRYTGRKKNDHKRSVLIVVLIILFTVLVFFLTVKLGLYLKEKAKLSEERRETAPFYAESDSKAESESESLILTAPENIKTDGKFISLSGIGGDAEKLAEAVSALEDGDFVSLIFRDAAGTLLYSSGVAQAVGTQDAENGLLGAPDILSLIKEKNCTVCAVFGINMSKPEDEAEEAVLVTLENAMISEICKAGADEILLCGFATPQISGEALVQEYISRAAALKEEYISDTPLGALLPSYLFADGEGSSVCRSLSASFDFLAADYTDQAEEENAAEGLRSRAESMQLCFSRYGLRAVLDIEKANHSFEKAALYDEAVYTIQNLAARELFGTAKSGE